MTYIPEDLSNVSSQVLKALLALRGDAAREMSVELQSVLDEINHISEELSKRELCKEKE